MNREKLSKCNVASELISKIKHAQTGFKDGKIEVMLKNQDTYTKIYCSGTNNEYTDRFKDKLKVIESVAKAMLTAFLNEEIETLEKEFKEL